MRQLNGQDATFLYLETPGAHLNLTGLYVYQQADGPSGPLRYPDIRQLIEQALSGVGELRQKLLRPPLDIDYPLWVDDAEFDMDHHLRAYAGPRLRSMRALFSAVAAIHTEAMDLSHPPWEMHIMDRLDGISGLPAHCFAVVMKYHHAAVDGASGAQLVDRLHGIGAAPLENQVAREAEPARSELLLRAALNNTAHVLKLASSLGSLLGSAAPAALRGLLDSSRSTMPFIKSSIEPGKPPVPLTRFNAAVSSERVMYAHSIDLQQLQAIKKAVPGATINDVLLAVCGGALRRWLLRIDELPEESLVAMVPVNTRSKADSDMPGNQISTRFLPIGTQIEDPLQRLVAVYAASQQAKSDEASSPPLQFNEINNNIPALPLALVARLTTGLGLAYRGPRLCNCTITNVPPPSSELHLGPAPLVYTTGSGPLLDGMGLIITIVSYAGTTNLCFTSCPEMLPDPAELARDAAAEIKHFQKIIESAR